MAQSVNITSPVGRIVQGSLYKPNTTDADGKPLLVKNGANAGKPRTEYYFALAIPKGGEQHWSHTAWGQQILAVGAQAFAQAYQSPAFAWKIEDGDSQVPNKRGRKPCENEGWRGNWVLKFSGGFQPKVYRQQGNDMVLEQTTDFVKPGYFVEVNFNVQGNDSAQTPGIYLNHSMVCFRAYGPEIVSGPDVASAGFGQSALPAGASLTPPPSSSPLPAAPAMGLPAAPAMGLPAAPAMGLPSVPGVPNPLVPGGFAQTPAAPAPVAPVPVTPNPQFLQVPAAPAAPAPVAPVRNLTALAQGATYEALIANGWTDATLIQNGLMLA